jgi:hypothetical protein
MCDAKQKNNPMYLGAVQRLREIFYIQGPEFEDDLWRVVLKHCRNGSSQTKMLKKGTRRCRQTYADLSSRPLFKEVFGGVVKMFRIRNPTLFYKDVGKVLVSHCGL